MARRTVPCFDPSLGKRDDEWSLVVKVKYNGTIKRFTAFVSGSEVDCGGALRSKIARFFKFSSDLGFILTYTDEDGDEVLLDDVNDLRDAAIKQKLNPLRIDVQLKNTNTEAPRTKHWASNSSSPRSIALEDQLAQVKSAIDEAMKFVPEQVPAVLAKLSHDLRSRAASSVPSLAELLDRLATLMTPKGNMQTSGGPFHGSSCSTSGGRQASRNTKIEHENELMTGSASQPADMQTAPGLKSVLPEDPKAQVEQAPVYHSLDSLNLTSPGNKKSDRKGNSVTESKVRRASQSKGKSTTSAAVPPVSSSTYAATPAPSVGENLLRYRQIYGQNGLVGLQPSSGPPVVPPYNRHLGSSGNINRDGQPSFAVPPTNMCGPSVLDMSSSVLDMSSYVPSKDDFYPFKSSYKYNVPSSALNKLDDRYSLGSSYNYSSIPQRALHKWIQCNGCGVTPIVGPRYKSNVKDDYDLCAACFSRMGNEFEYTRLDKPAPVINQKLLERLQGGELKLECSFISDITIPDGTSVAPSNPFTKIWRLRNSGCAVWPFGTQVIWAGGHPFAVQSFKLGISVNGVAGGQEVDVAVDFLAPAKPGRYISYWRLALPSGKEFGQQFWVHIQVEERIQNSGNKLSAATNLNLSPAANSTALNPFIIDLESESESDSPTAPSFHPSNYREMLARFQKPVVPKESEPASTTLPSIPAAVKQVQSPTTYHHASFAGSASALVAAAVSATPETIPQSKSFSFAAPLSASSVPAPASLPAHIPASVPTAVLPDETVNHKEENLLRELEELGFEDADLNKEILRRNKYDVEQSVCDLCCLGHWDPLLDYLSELGFTDTEMIKEAVAEGGGGNMRGLVRNLVARAKEDL